MTRAYGGVSLADRLPDTQCGLLMVREDRDQSAGKKEHASERDQGSRHGVATHRTRSTSLPGSRSALDAKARRRLRALAGGCGDQQNDGQGRDVTSKNIATTKKAPADAPAVIAIHRPRRRCLHCHAHSVAAVSHRPPCTTTSIRCAQRNVSSVTTGQERTNPTTPTFAARPIASAVMVSPASGTRRSRGGRATRQTRGSSADGCTTQSQRSGRLGLLAVLGICHQSAQTDGRVIVHRSTSSSCCRRAEWRTCRRTSPLQSPVFDHEVGGSPRFGDHASARIAGQPAPESAVVREASKASQ
jgi:hypothetical protein